MYGIDHVSLFSFGMIDGESCFLDTPTPEAFDVVTLSTSQSTYVKACKMLSITPSTFCFRCLNEISLVIPHHGIGPNGAKAVAIALVVNYYIYRCIINLNCLHATPLDIILLLLQFFMIDYVDIRPIFVFICSLLFFLDGV